MNLNKFNNVKSLFYAFYDPKNDSAMNTCDFEVKIIRPFENKTSFNEALP